MFAEDGAFFKVEIDIMITAKARLVVQRQIKYKVL